MYLINLYHQISRWDNGNHQIAFSRGGVAFMAMNNEEGNDLSMTLQTGMPSGSYCDVISGDITSDGSSCTGTQVEVDGSGNAYISLSAASDDPFLAIHSSKSKGFIETLFVVVYMLKTLTFHYSGCVLKIM